MEFLKKNYRYFLFFSFTFLIVFFLLYLENTYDALWEYGMSHAIRIGEIPYRDFNTVSTPFFIMLFSTGLWIYDSFSIYLLEFCFLYTFLYYLLYRLLGKKSIWIILSMCISLFNPFFASYNALAFVFIVLLMVLEKEEKSDVLIGFILGLLILTKHTIGLPVLVLSCVGVRDLSRILKRIKGCISPLIAFLIYLLFSRSFLSFLDLCFFGLFDFGKNNHMMLNGLLILSILMFGYTIYRVWKEPKNLLFYYALGSIFFVLPICELGHFAFFFSLFFIPIVEKCEKKIFPWVPYLFIGLFLVLNILLRIDSYSTMTLSKYSHFEGTFISSNTIPVFDEILEEVSRHENTVILDNRGMFINTTLNRKIDYFGVPLNGNFGYHGNLKMKKKIDSMKDTYFYIDTSYYESITSKEVVDSQYNLEIVQYVMDKAKEIGKVGIYTIYYWE